MSHFCRLRTSCRAPTSFNLSRSPHWQIIAYGCSWISTAIATAYDTLGESGLQHSLNEPECKAVFTNADLLQSVANVVANVPSLRLVIYDGEPKPAVLEKINNTREGLRTIHIDELRELGRGKSLDLLKDRLPTPKTVACIMYTSGSTGPPKGVVIPHSNLIASVGSIWTLMGQHLRPEDTYLAYLPLAHILEYVVELALFFVGMTFGYGRVKTLTDASVRNCLGDIRTLRPSIMIGVPAVWEMIRKGITAQINKGSGLKKSVFTASMRIKKANIPGLTSVIDSVVLSQIKAATGGRLRLTLSGGAALSRETQEFLTLALVTVLQGKHTAICRSCDILILTVTCRLRYDRVLRYDGHSSTGAYAVLFGRSAHTFGRGQASGRPRGRLSLHERPSSGRSSHSRSLCHTWILQAS